MKDIKLKLQDLVFNFRKWLSENYSQQNIQELLFDDAGYPDWNEIEDFYSELLEKDLIKNLDKEDEENLLYLISRNWDRGRMIAWLSTGSQLSNLGNLKKNDFINLSKTLSKINKVELDDAKSQFVSSFKKISSLTQEIEEILLVFYNEKNEYTKRLALITLGKLGYSDIKKIIKISWETIDDEHHKMGCLYVIHEILNDKELLTHYLSLLQNKESENLKNYISEITKQKNYN
ncbi:hypothetical protein IRZ71_06395 [Flavobacterium sp. ANB]|uniref:hypothetical protein n=1 Tax=unclassified Flavobacterium TaxID=196869 RepID=UPI0012B80F42|nr:MULTISPECIES: hypothetical protein [unclassified Flavobacterium]MBF4515962.1 hypothetical protein [Flavobacterium sp. ANB]MTD68964.1 hypothetical protein [Flavobacterium sp. LC2016-13]